ncbi:MULTISPECIES: murein biosynthesis integral membrane protein MurJ [Aminobacterium]|jgi:putative peptidoglycan lipid II flippase|uniref:murein biosynthesis integral membrane protein MurJ n=1 Tax=Aminobacterium TaxID=81466 RepID=UPI0004646AE2|nr:MULTISPECIES: murein biosynthesis integral membrane protein MurJ [Aminobacterium]
MSSRVSRMVRHALVMMVGTFASRILGLAREIVTAALFGASSELDAFYIAYTLANLSRQMLAEGALSAAFVPVFSQSLAQKGKERAAYLAKQAFSILLIAGFSVVLVGIFFSPLLVKIMAPGFDAVKASLAVSMTRWLFPFLLLVSLAALAMGVLNSLDSYFVPAIAPALSNVVYLLVLFLLVSRCGIWTLVVAVLAGGVCQWGLQWFWSAWKGVPLVPAKPDRHDKDLRKMMTLFFPYALGLSLNQVNPVVSRMLGSFLQDGAISVLNYANRVIQLPLGLFVIAISQAVLPELSRCATGDNHEFKETVQDSVRFALFIVLPVTVGLILVSDEVVNFLFYRGAFDSWAWHATGKALAMYAWGLPGMACTTIFLRGLYAQSSPRAALMVTASSVVFNIIFCLLLIKPMGFSGLALATSLGFTVSAIVGGYLLSKVMEKPLHIFTVQWSGRIVGILAIMSGAVWQYRKFLLYPVGASLPMKGIWILAVFIIGAVVYGGCTWFFSFKEWGWLMGAFSKKRSFRGENMDDKK